MTPIKDTTVATLVSFCALSISSLFNAFCPVQFTFCYGDLSNPWDHGEQATRVFQYYTRLHNELLPYIYSAAIEAHQTGRPILRRAPGDLQYLFGPDLLVAPIYRDELIRKVTFPAGEWIDYWDESKVYTGHSEIDYPAPLDHIPLFLRAGAIIPMEVRKNWTGHGTANSAGALTVQVYPFERSERAFLEPAGKTLFRCSKAGQYAARGDVRFELDGVSRKYVLRIKTLTEPREVRGKNGTLPRRPGESELAASEAAWCFDQKARMTVVRLPEVKAEDITIQMASEK